MATSFGELMKTIEQSRDAGKKAGTAEAQRIIGAHLNRQNVDTLAQLARKIPEARDGLAPCTADSAEDAIRRAFWFAYLAEIEPAVAGASS